MEPNHRKCDVRTSFLESVNDRNAKLGRTSAPGTDDEVNKHPGLSMKFVIQFLCHLYVNLLVFAVCMPSNLDMNEIMMYLFWMQHRFLQWLAWSGLMIMSNMSMRSARWCITLRVMRRCLFFGQEGRKTWNLCPLMIWCSSTFGWMWKRSGSDVIVDTKKLFVAYRVSFMNEDHGRMGSQPLSSSNFCGDIMSQSHLNRLKPLKDTTGCAMGSEAMQISEHRSGPDQYGGSKCDCTAEEEKESVSPRPFFSHRGAPKRRSAPKPKASNKSVLSQMPWLDPNIHPSRRFPNNLISEVARTHIESHPEAAVMRKREQEDVALEVQRKHSCWAPGCSLNFRSSLPRFTRN